MTAFRPSRKSKLVAAVIAGAVVVPAIFFRAPLLWWFTPTTTTAPHHQTPAAANDVDHYTCSMHPSVHQTTPGACPICGMTLIPVTTGQQRESVVTIPAARQQLIGVRIASVVQAPLVRSIRAVGRVAYDESNVTEVSSRVHGWIETMLVSTTGQAVQKGQALFTLYSPELYSAEQDFLLAMRAGRGQELAHAARQRLHFLDLSDAQIDDIAQRGRALDRVAVVASRTGIVTEKEVVEGAAIEPGTRLYRIAALDKVWIEADVYEADLATIQIGESATVTLDYLPGRNYQARVAYVYPYLNAEARTGTVRLELANKKQELRPGMYTSVLLQSDVGLRLQVPESAVVYTGPRRLVFVDLGDGRFRPQEVQVGAAAQGMYEVLSGLHVGERVASSGVFLIAAEARISTAATYWNSP